MMMDYNMLTKQSPGIPPISPRATLILRFNVSVFQFKIVLCHIEVSQIFQKSIHTRPTLSLYKSLLKLTSKISIPQHEEDLRRRIFGAIRRRFRLNKNCYSPRLVKHQLVNAFEVPSFSNIYIYINIASFSIGKKY